MAKIVLIWMEQVFNKKQYAPEPLSFRLILQVPLGSIHSQLLSEGPVRAFLHRKCGKMSDEFYWGYIQCSGSSQILNHLALQIPIRNQNLLASRIRILILNECYGSYPSNFDTQNLTGLSNERNFRTKKTIVFDFRSVPVFAELFLSKIDSPPPRNTESRRTILGQHIGTLQTFKSILYGMFKHPH